MKRPIEWHRQCLANAKAHLKLERAALDRAQANYDRLASEVSRTEAQIINAEAEGVTEFDPERFGWARRRKP